MFRANIFMIEVYIATIWLPLLRNGMVAILYAKRSSCLHHFKTERNGHLYGTTERNRRNQTGPKPIGFKTGEKLFSSSTSLSLNDSTILDALF